MRVLKVSRVSRGDGHRSQSSDWTWFFRKSGSKGKTAVKHFHTDTAAAFIGEVMTLRRFNHKNIQKYYMCVMNW